MEAIRAIAAKSVLITGSTGFVGRALTQRLVGLNQLHNLGLQIFPVARARSDWQDNLLEAGLIPAIVHSDFSLPLQCGVPIDLIFHCATPASAELNAFSPAEMLHLNIRGMEWVLSSETAMSKKPVVIFTSSGAVYGKQPNNLSHIPESYLGGPDTTLPTSAYAEGKRVAEYMLCEAGANGQLHARIARLFAFSGVGLPLDRHFAIGNFVRQARESQDIVVRGTGLDIRSYLDVDDMVDWLIKIGIDGADARPYNVGSEDALTIGDLAVRVAERSAAVLGTRPQVRIEGRQSAIDGASNYVPSTERIRRELRVSQSVSLDDSIDKMMLQ